MRALSAWLAVALISSVASTLGAEQGPEQEIAELLAGARESLQSPVLGGGGCVIQDLACGQTVFRSISITDCSTSSGIFTDFFEFDGIAGQTVTIDMTSFDFNPFLILFDPDIEVVAEDDDSGPGDSARIVYLIDRTSTEWGLSATPLEPFVFGDYILSLSCSGSTPMPPAAPSNLVATATSSSSIDLSWQDNSNNETSFRIERRSGGGGFSEIASVGANVERFTDTGRSPSTAYDYRVRARNSDGNSAYSNVASATTQGTGPTGPCVEDDHTLCLLGGRFRVEVDFTPPNGSTQPANAIPFTDRAGLFWFFNENNVEMLVKMQNACVAPFNRFWVFFAATTNVQFQVRVTDTDEGLTKFYDNPQGTVALPVADTQAFATCP